MQCNEIDASKSGIRLTKYNIFSTFEWTNEIPVEKFTRSINEILGEADVKIQFTIFCWLLVLFLCLICVETSQVFV